MTEAVDRHPVTSDLMAINRELAEVLRCEPAELVVGAEEALGDEVVICGLLGGKDVGKSTLINALAQREVSVDSESVGEGTSGPIAYVHEDSQAAVSERLREINYGAAIEVVTHRVDPLRNAVLLDLPDFDSEFPDHLETVREIAPLLDRVLWVLTPRKVGDREWVAMFHRVIKDAGNVHCVLNKVDELLLDTPAVGDDNGKAAGFWRQQGEWMEAMLETSGFKQSGDHRFMVAAAYPESKRFVEHISLLWDDPDWSKYDSDRGMVAEVAELASCELNRLRERVLGPVSAEEARAIKLKNRDRELEVLRERIARHFDLKRVIERLSDVCDSTYVQSVLNEAAGPGYCAEIALRLHSRMGSDKALADELLDRRVQRWPLLRIVYWPFGWLSRTVGRRLSASVDRSKEQSSTKRVAIDEVDSRGLEDRVGLLRARVLAEHGMLADRLGIAQDLPPAETLADGARDSIERLEPAIEERFLDSIAGQDGHASRVGRAGLWFVLLWFPLLQPLAEGVLGILSAGGSLSTLDFAQGAYSIVAALSAVHLLSSLAVVVLIYLAVLAAMYGRCLRAVRLAHGLQDEISPIAREVDEILTNRIAVPMVQPFATRLGRLLSLRRRLDAPMASSLD